MVRERRAYICTHKAHVACAYRVFVNPGDPEPPRCPDHGPMTRQMNMPYVKPTTKPLKRRRKGTK